MSMRSLRAIVPLALVTGALSASPALASPAPPPKAHAAGDAAVELIYPSLVTKRLDRVQRSLDRAEDYVDDGNKLAASTALLAARHDLTAAWRGAQYAISTAPPPPPAEEARLHAGASAGASMYAKKFRADLLRQLRAARAKRGLSAHAAGDPVGPTIAAPADTAFLVLSAQHEAIATAFGLVDATSGAFLDAPSKTMFAALNQRDAAVAFIRTALPPTPPDPEGGEAEPPLTSTSDTVMPNVIPQIDDEAQHASGLLTGGTISAGGRRILQLAQSQAALTKNTINTVWPPAPPAED
jgi:hypothetical protein